MKLKRLLIVFFATIALCASGLLGCTVTVQPTPSSSGPAQGDVTLFYDQLAPYGEWFSLEGYGWVWTPYDTPPGWRPYTEGRWVYTDYGWTWVSSWEWGWAPFHYGRWLFDPQYGWVWVPGTEWAPAWVVWRYGLDKIGWAPLPPRVDWRGKVGIDVIRPGWWSFVHEQSLGEPNLRAHIIPPARNLTLIQYTQNVTNYTVVQNRVINRSISVDQIERTIQRPIPRYRVVDRDSAPRLGEQIKGNEVYMFRHHLAEPSPGRTPPGEKKKPMPAQGKRPGMETPPTSSVPSQELLKRQDSERRALDTHHEAERTKMEEHQRKEMERPPKGVTRSELRNQHEAEHRTLEEQIRNEKQLLKQRQEREKKEGIRSKGSSPRKEKQD